MRGFYPLETSFPLDTREPEFYDPYVETSRDFAMLLLFHSLPTCPLPGS
jgi:hypothetical protein